MPSFDVLWARGESSGIHRQPSEMPSCLRDQRKVFVGTGAKVRQRKDQGGVARSGVNRIVVAEEKAAMGKMGSGTELGGLLGGKDLQRDCWIRWRGYRSRN